MTSHRLAAVRPAHATDAVPQAPTAHSPYCAASKSWCVAPTPHMNESTTVQCKETWQRYQNVAKSQANCISSNPLYDSTAQSPNSSATDRHANAYISTLQIAGIEPPYPLRRTGRRVLSRHLPDLVRDPVSFQTAARSDEAWSTCRGPPVTQKQRFTVNKSQETRQIESSKPIHKIKYFFKRETYCTSLLRWRLKRRSFIGGQTNTKTVLGHTQKKSNKTHQVTNKDFHIS